MNNNSDRRYAVFERKHEQSGKVYDFLKKYPNKWFCDDCVEKATRVDRHEVNTVGWTLALFPDEFSRKSTACSSRCSNRDKMATQAI